ncbi:MAG: site-2 protease family protein [Phycisphaerales bacterium]
MGWETRDYNRDQGGGGFREGLRRLFGGAENPLGWSLRLYRAWGIDVRLHILFIIFVVIELLYGVFGSGIGLRDAAMAVGSLFLLVLLHEYGHCIACRNVGGTADQILLWPLGGLASCAPPPNWRADLITTIGGPAVNAVLWVLLGGALLVALPESTRLQAVLFNPFEPGAAVGALQLADGSRPLWLTWLWWVYYLNAALFLFNVLLPMYPMDSARIVQAIIWARVGRRRATAIVVNLGLVVAVAVGLIGAIQMAGLLLALAIFSGFSCWNAKKQLAESAGDPALEGYNFERGYAGMPAEEPEPAAERESRAQKRRRQQEAEEQAELDRILAKIARAGMASLTPSEKRWLERATERRRRA